MNQREKKFPWLPGDTPHKDSHQGVRATAMPQSIKRRRARATAEQPSLWSYVAPLTGTHWGIPRAVRARMAEIAAPPVKIELPKPPRKHTLIQPAPFRMCRTCRVVLPLDNFAVTRRGRSHNCPACSEKKPETPEVKWDRNLRRLYGITSAEYEAMLAAQGGVCAICGQVPPEPVEAIGRGKRYGRLAVDHDHATGKVRALLCAGCNTAIGNFRDDTDVMLKAIGYVRRHRQAS